MRHHTSDVARDGKRFTRTSWAALATAASGEPEAPGMCTWYGLNRPVIASTASYTADWAIALSRKLVAPGWTGRWQLFVWRSHSNRLPHPLVRLTESRGVSPSQA